LGSDTVRTPPNPVRAMVLERGATRRRAPRNAASYLISRALRLGGWQIVKAFSDERFGERGLVYKASGFQKCPPSKYGWDHRYGLAIGNRVLSDRAIYRRFGSHSAARAAGAQIVRLPARIAWGVAGRLTCWQPGPAPGFLLPISYQNR
jgi:hypothetical protein